MQNVNKKIDYKLFKNLNVSKVCLLKKEMEI